MQLSLLVCFSYTQKKMQTIELNFFIDTGTNILILNENFKLLQKIVSNVGEKCEQISCMCLSFNQETNEELVEPFYLNILTKWTWSIFLLFILRSGQVTQTTALYAFGT